MNELQEDPDYDDWSQELSYQAQCEQDKSAFEDAPNELKGSGE